MEKLTSFLILIVLSINTHGQGIDQFIGKYTVTDIWSQVSGDAIIHIDTAFYEIKILRFTDDEILMLNFAQLDTIKATCFSDSIKFSQTLYYDEWNNYMISGSGRFYTDTVKYQYKSGGTSGSFKGSCIGIKVNGNSINDLFQNNKSLINLYSIKNGLLRLQLKSNISGEISLYTPDGKQVLKKPITGKESNFYAPASGLLLYRFENEKGEIQTGKVLVR